MLAAFVCALAACDDPPTAPLPPTSGYGRDGDAGLGASTDFDAGAPPHVSCKEKTPWLDLDHDGVTPGRGDCDDCEALVNPHALDVPNNRIDEDCSGADATELPASCDAKLRADSADPQDAARALGLCSFVTERSGQAGVVSARVYGMSPDVELESPLQVWLPERFGTNGAREGGRVLVLSTGVARDPSSREFTPGCDVLAAKRDRGGFTNGVAPPAGYPKDSSRCKQQDVSAQVSAYNAVSFELTLRAPSNARSLSFASMFFTYEYPDFVCSRYNDFFVALVDPAPEEADDANVLFDERGDPIGVNTGLLSVCRKSPRPARAIACKLGPALLEGTGYDRGESTCLSEVSLEPDIGGASTGWLETTVPVAPSALVTLRFLLWDSGDPLLDSTVVIDALRWSVEAPTLGTHPITSAE